MSKKSLLLGVFFVAILHMPLFGMLKKTALLSKYFLPKNSRFALSNYLSSSFKNNVITNYLLGYSKKKNVLLNNNISGNSNNKNTYGTYRFTSENNNRNKYHDTGENSKNSNAFSTPKCNIL